MFRRYISNNDNNDTTTNNNNNYYYYYYYSFVFSMALVDTIINKIPTYLHKTISFK